MGNRELQQNREKGNTYTTIQEPKCKYCKLSCPLKTQIVRHNPNSYCVVPEAREHAIKFSHPVMNGEILEGLAIKVLRSMGKNIRDSSNSNEKERFLRTLINFKQVFYPAIQRTANVNMNIDATDAAKQIIDAIIEK